jgi:hypothetical protein
MANRRRYAVDFRSEEATQVFAAWAAAEAVSMVGIGSVGKTNLLHHLSDRQVAEAYLGDIAASTHVIVVDANMLGPLPHPTDVNAQQFRCWAGAELIMHRMFLTLYPFSMLSADEAQRFYESYQALQNGDNPLYSYMGVRYLELGLEYFLRRDLRIILLFDEFEELLLQMPPRFFQNLRGLRDNHKSNLIYTTFSRSPLPVLAERMALPAPQMESFLELFTDNVVYVGPYNDTDARDMLTSLSRRRSQPIPDLAGALLLEATGRFAGLLRAGFHIIDDYRRLDWSTQTAETFGDLLAQNSAIRSECQSIWAGLNHSEQTVLKAVAKLRPYEVSTETELAVSMLVQKRLLRLLRPDQRLVIEPPVFRAFVRSDPSEAH